MLCSVAIKLFLESEILFWLLFNFRISVSLHVFLDCQSSLQEYSCEWERDIGIFHLHGEEQQEQAGPEIRRQQATRMKINKTWNNRDLEGTDGIVHFRFIKTVEVYCKFFLNAVSLDNRKKPQTFLSGVFENMCPACFWRLLPLISKSHWNNEMRIMGKPSKPVGLWSLSTWHFKLFLEIYISVQFRSQMEFFHWIQTTSQTTVQFALAQDWDSGRDEIHYWGAWARSLLCLALGQCFKSQISTNVPAHQIYSSEHYLTGLKSINFFQPFFIPPLPTWMPNNSLQSFSNFFYLRTH